MEKNIFYAGPAGMPLGKVYYFFVVSEGNLFLIWMTI